MSSWKRGFLEITAEILDSLSSSPLKKTHITFKCNLDSRAVTKYLTIMRASRLIDISERDSSFYIITQKGIKYRNQFNSFVSMVEEDLENIPFNNNNYTQVIAKLKPKN